MTGRFKGTLCSHHNTNCLSLDRMFCWKPYKLFSESNVKNFTQFATFISNKSFGQEILVSLDITSLFTNVPVGLACQVAQDRLIADTSLGDRTGLSPPQVVTLLQFRLNATYLTYQEQFLPTVLWHSHGLHAVSVTVANLVMEDIEQRARSMYPHPPFWKRYVDDTYTALLLMRFTPSMSTSTRSNHEFSSPKRWRKMALCHSWTQR